MEMRDSTLMRIHEDRSAYLLRAQIEFPNLSQQTQLENEDCPMNKSILRSIPAFAILLLISAGTAATPAQNATLNAQFTATPIVVDGLAEPAWNNATPANIAICMKSDLSAPLPGCAASGTVGAMWDGPMLYLLFTVNDPDITTRPLRTRIGAACRCSSIRMTTSFPSLRRTMATS
jgi:hypothetical protein